MIVGRYTLHLYCDAGSVGAAVAWTQEQIDWLREYSARLITLGLHPLDVEQWVQSHNPTDFEFDSNPVDAADQTYQDFFANPDDDGPVDLDPAGTIAAQSAELEALRGQVQTLRAENEAVRQALVTAEFMTGDPDDTSDVLDVLGVFIEHHKGKEAENKALREALGRCGRHTDGCGVWSKVHVDALGFTIREKAQHPICTCGLDAALSGKQEG